MLGAIGLCVDNLPNDMKCFYQDFALFVEDVNIRPEVKLFFAVNTWLSCPAYLIFRPFLVAGLDSVPWRSFTFTVFLH
jgi:hypothetical protein